MFLVRYILLLFLLAGPGLQGFAAQILIPMDDAQQNHLKAYGIAYHVLTYDVEVSWLLNYRGGSFMFEHHREFEEELTVRGVSYEIIADVQAGEILREIAGTEVNTEEIRLHKVPDIAVYTPPNSLPWDDAVTLALTYAEIPFDEVYDEEVLSGQLPAYDWLHLHHEDFTGQFGKFWLAFRDTDWYQEDVRLAEETARTLGYAEVADLKLDVAKAIRDFVEGGGYMFAMCSAPESIDIALAAEGVDILHEVYNETPPDPDAQ
ncbi:MAG: asparagine synthetase B, partial [Bacteroidales bacterium]